MIGFKHNLEKLLLKARASGRNIGQICQEADVAPRVLYELRRRKYQTPPTTTAIDTLAPVLGVSRERLLRMVCANTPAAKILAAQARSSATK